MGMEHRWSERKNIVMDVTLHYGPVGKIAGKTRDVSLEGMFVKTDGLVIPARSEVMVTFATKEEHGELNHCVPAYVVHNNDAGVGLMLRHNGYKDFYALRDMLQAA